jgi:N-acetylglucosaminyl-diphospho-decaprenol L-rhamnosyltransferase
VADLVGTAAHVNSVTVTYDSGHVVGRCLASLDGVRRIVVVDNASRDDSREIAAAGGSNVSCIANDTNQGFGAANNLGFAEASDAEFVLFINPDAALQPGALNGLIAAARRYPEAAIIAPRIVGPGGATETTYDAGLFERDGMPRHPGLAPEGDLCVGFLSGAVIMVRTAALADEPPFDPEIFLFFDDDDLCLRLRVAGHSLVLAAAATAEHTAGQGVRTGPGLAWRRHWHMAWSRLYFEAKHRGRASALSTGATNIARFGAKCVGYRLVRNRAKADRDAARFAGTLAWMLGRQSRTEKTLN